MAPRGTPNRGRGRGAPPGTPRGGGRGRGGGGGRGRGRGGGAAMAAQDFTGVSLDYEQLSEAALGFNPSPKIPSTPHAKPAFLYKPTGTHTPNLYSAYPPTPPNNSNSQASSGYTTPKQGLGAQRGGRGGGGGGGGRGMFGGGGGGRGGMIGGLGFHAGSPAGGVGRGRGRGGPVVGMGQGSFRPLLVPVSFVKASGLTPALNGDEDKAMTAEPVEEPQPGELEERVMQGSLVAEVRDLDLEDIESKELPLAAGAEDSPMDSEEATSLEEDEEVQRALVASFAVQQQPREVEEEDSSEDEEQIVFHPQSTASSAPPPAAAENEPDTSSSPPLFVIDTEPSPVTLADSSASSVPLGAPVPLPKASKESALPPPIPVAAPTPSPAPQPTKAKLAPHPQPQPQAKLTKGQKAALKKAGKKARKAGKAHARSGNRHLFAPAPDGYSDAEDAAEGEAMFEKMDAVDLSDSEEEEEEGDQAAEEMGAPRVGDSDLEWGSNGPQSDGEEDGGAPRASGKERKAARRQQRQEQKDAERMARLSMGARGQVDRALGQSSTQAEREAMTTAMGLKTGGTKGGKRGRKQIEILAAEDYERNVLGLEPDVEDEDEAMDLKAAESFARGLIGVKSGRQPTLDEMEDRARDELVASDGWRTSSGEDDDDESGKEDASDGESEGSDDRVDTGDEVEMDHSLAEADASVDLAIAAEEDALFDQDASFDSSLATSDEDAAIERALLAGGTIRLSSMGQTGSGGRRDVKERKRVAKGKGKQVVESESDSSDDDDAMFEGGNTWADNDEDYIRGVQEIIAANADLLERGGDRKARKKLFKAVEQGNFEDVDFDFEDDYALTAGPSKKKNKKVKPDFSNSAFDSDLEDQWSKDRSKKSEYKRQRALARAEAVDATSMSKKGPRAPPSFAGSSDAAFLNSRIRDFLLYDLSSPSMALPPMSKKSRVAVHLLAETYGMKSKSLGKGKARFPVLERTSRSTIYGVDERKIKAILGTAGGEREGGYHGGKAKGKMGGLWAALNGDGKKSGGGGGGGGGGGKKNSEGAVVGQGADALGEGNIGFALLKKMGWTEGSQIGVSGGLSEPISARIKTSKSGLGSGYSVSRTEAQALGKSNDQW